MDRELNAAERTLFAHVAYDIREHPDNYREAGIWLDRYYDDDKLCWERRQLELMRQIKRIEDGHVYYEYEDCLLPELKEGLASELPPPLWMRLAYALEDLWLNYRMWGVLAEEDARAILIIAWVVTDAEANRADLGITKFADLPWKKARLGFIHDLFLERKAITSRTHFFKYDDESFLRLVYIAWQKLFGGTIDGAMIIKEMRRALVGEKRLSGLDEQNNMDAVRHAIPNLEADRDLESEKTTKKEQKIKLVKEPKKTDWKPPKGYIGSKEIVNDYEVPRSTLQGWAERDKNKVKKDPQTREVYYTKKWFDNRFKNYQPRRKS